MPRSRFRKSLIIVSLTVIAACALLRIYFAFVPRGASPMPYLLASVDGGKLESPDGTLYEIWFNDAGAAHSGNHWTWIVQNHFVFGKHVIAEGYLGPEFAVDGNTLPVSWNGNNPVIEFQSGRYGN